MQKIRLTKHFSFEAAHALHNYDGKCSRLHGHSYQLFVTVIGTPDSNPDSPKCGMVMDFGLLKKIVNEEIIDKYDHSVVLNEKSAFHPCSDSQMFSNVSWKGRKPRIKCDYVNVTLDIGYNLLFNMVDSLLQVYGFDVYCGIYHKEFYMIK